MRNLIKILIALRMWNTHY